MRKPVILKHIIFIGFVCLSTSLFSQNRINLNEGWKFRKANSNDQWLNASVPSTVHSDLLKNGAIPDPYKGCNHNDIEWIENASWEYSLDFNSGDINGKLKNPILVFEGLDTYADVYLNDTKILVANNMFRTWEVDLNGKITSGLNNLRIVFHPASNYIKKHKDLLDFTLPGGEWAYIRKAAYQFGWDFAPRMVTSGIWKPVYLIENDGIKLRDGLVITKSINQDTAFLKALFVVNSNNQSSASLSVVDTKTKKTLATQQVILSKGENRYNIEFPILNPQLWWPNGMGDQSFYSFNLVLNNESGEVQNLHNKVGIRTIKLINEKDLYGTSFYFEVNGTPIFAKGANIVPPHSFDISNSSQWVSLVKEAHEVNMNMLRVWGGGIYPPNEFYQACDSLGIMVWQDFMFACSMYPWDIEFIDNVRHEAKEQIQRLSRYPSLALLCGNNEIDEGWHNWGWQRELGDSITISEVWKGYDTLFHKVLPEAIYGLDSVIPYWPSSPQYGWGKEESIRHGDSHYWGVWWGEEPFETYKQKVPRFMSEYGFQSFPTLETIKQMGDGESLPDSTQISCHQKHPTGFETINNYLEKKGWEPKNLEQSIYLSQVHQALGYQMAIETHRMAAPRTMGSLYWQLNDCWPAISWSTIDFSGQWKASHYQVKHSYSPILVVPTIERNRLYVSLVNDSPEEVEGMLTIQVFDPNGKKLGIWKEYVTNITSTPRRVFRTELYEELEDEAKIPLMAHVQFAVDWYDSYHGFTTNFDLSEFQLDKLPTIKHRVVNERDKVYIEFTSNRPALYVEITNKDGDLKLSDNYFHLLPKVKYTVRVIEGNFDELIIKSLVDYVDKNKE